jgi:hypothetical protein
MEYTCEYSHGDQFITLLKQLNFLGAGIKELISVVSASFLVLSDTPFESALGDERRVNSPQH